MPTLADLQPPTEPTLKKHYQHRTSTTFKPFKSEEASAAYFAKLGRARGDESWEETRAAGRARLKAGRPLFAPMGMDEAIVNGRVVD